MINKTLFLKELNRCMTKHSPCNHFGRRNIRNADRAEIADLIEQMEYSVYHGGTEPDRAHGALDPRQTQRGANDSQRVQRVRGE